jgi:hypothetical protein
MRSVVARNVTRVMPGGGMLGFVPLYSFERQIRIEEDWRRPAINYVWIGLKDDAKVISFCDASYSH